MAPRGRARVRNTRMDAAIDAMGRMGFEEGAVRAKVNELLKVYDKDHGWPFIEDNAYILLIEALLNPSEEKAEDGGEENGESSHSQNNPTEEQDAPVATTSNVIADSEQIGHDVVQPVSVSVGTEANVNNWKDIRLDRSSTEDETALVMSNISNNLPAQVAAISQSSSKAISEPASQKAFRRPCYGWLDYDEGELDFVYLKPAETHTPISSNGNTSKRIRRKSRWDLTPDDL